MDTDNPAPTPTPTLRALPSTAGADAIVRRWTLWSAGLGLVPVPFVDFVTTSGCALKMLHSLAGYYGVPFRADAGKSAVTSLLGGAASPVLAGAFGSVVRAIPLVGAPIALLSGAAFAGGITYAIGRVFTAHFGAGGTLFDFDPEAFRDYFVDQVEAGKAFVHKSREPAAPSAAT